MSISFLERQGIETLLMWLSKWGYWTIKIGGISQWLFTRKLLTVDEKVILAPLPNNHEELSVITENRLMLRSDECN
jgi:hypothetical protein